MKYSNIILLTVLLAVLVQAQPDNLYNTKRLIVKFKANSEIYKSLRQISPTDYKDAIRKEQININSQALSLFDQIKVQSIKPAKPTNVLTPLSDGVDRIFFLDFEDVNALELAYKSLKDNKDVEYVEYDFIGKGGGQKSVQLIPNDAGFNSQWGLRNTGQSIIGVSGKAGADINIINAWELTTGNSETKIAILDSGIPLNAAEFSGRILPGYDYVHNDNNPTDDLGHGTNVASIAAAKGNNSIGIAGINWNCQIIPIKILDSTNFGYYSWWISAMMMAADSGAQVINMSVGGSSFSQGLANAAAYAYSKGSVIVACMMNENNEVTYYPAGFNNVISVGALNNLDERAVPFCWGGGSNYGSHIDFMAPGNWILGLNYLNPDQTSYWCGTSQATPMVTGVISLMKGINSKLTFEEIYEILKSTSKDRIGNSAEDTGGWDKYYGWGRIDAREALSGAVISVEVGTETSMPEEFVLNQNYPNPFNPRTKINYSIPESSFVTLKVYDILGNNITTLVNEEKSRGTYEVEFNGANQTSGVYFYKLQAADFIQTHKMILIK